MRRLFMYVILTWAIPATVFAQAPPIQWQRTIGGSGDDRLMTLRQTNDGGYIAAGVSNSGISGEKTEASRGLYDFWIVKLDISGGIEWQKTFGGSFTDQPFSLIQAADGGYLVSGYSMSDMSGDKTEGNRGTAGSTALGMDGWILKLTATGNIQWQRTYGTNGNDAACSVIQRDGGSYIVASTSEWHNGMPPPLPPDRTTVNYTFNDFWYLKLDPLTGAIQQQVTHGGNRHDNACYILQTADGGYISGSISGSGAGTGDKTTPLYGGYDNWIIKMDSNFSYQWQLELGGAQDDWGIGNGNPIEVSGDGGIEQTSDGGYIVGNDSWSGISGNKTEASFGMADWWLVKLNSTGGISWQKELGGTGDDLMATVIQTPGGGYFAAGTSGSPVSGNKTESSRGGNDFWLVQLDGTGNIEWQKALGGSGDDRMTIARRTTDGGYILGGFSKSNISGEKSENSRGDYDFWIIKLGKCDTTIYKDDSICTGDSYRLPGGNLVSVPGIYTDTLSSSAHCDSIVITTLSYVADSIHLMNGRILGPDTTLCAGGTLQLNAIYPGAKAYLWSTGSATPSINVTSTNDYEVAVTSVNGCTVRDTIHILFAPRPEIDLGPDTTVCGRDIPLTLRSAQPPGSRYLWSNGLSDPQIEIVWTNRYWLEVTLGNCKASDSVFIKVIREPEVNIGRDSVICEQFPLRTGTEIPGAAYRWNTGETTSYIQVSKTDNYILEVNLEGCLLYDTIAITAMPAPRIDLGGNRDICSDETVMLDAEQSGNNRYQWNTGATTPSYAAGSAGMYWVVVTTEYRCTGGDTVLLTYIPKPVISLGPDTTVCEETPLILTPVQLLNTDSLLWSDGSTGNTLRVRYGGTYIVTGMNKCGAGSDTIDVSRVFCDIWLPNVFTPNGDGINDVFRVLGNTGRLEGFNFSVFNRWGERLFYTTDRLQGWDGKHNGHDALLGTYVYMLQYSVDGKPYFGKGNLHLLR